MSSEQLSVTYKDIETAAQRLKGQAHVTPVLTSTTVNNLTKAQVFFKCENFQRTGSFKFRGAYNALSKLSEAQNNRESLPIHQEIMRVRSPLLVSC